MIMASALFSAYKEKGYYVCVNASDYGYGVIKNDPNVDEILLQARDQIPNQELKDYWKALARYFDKLVNLSESIEGNLLPAGEHWVTVNGERFRVAADPNYELDKDERHKRCNRNYIEETFKFGDIEFSRKHQPRFYPTKKEVKKAQKFCNSHGKKTVMFVLSGSSVHKAYPWTDYVISRILAATRNVQIVLTGDHFCQILEQGWEKESRVTRTSGEWPIRDTLALAQMCDVVIGPETGVLNAVSAEQVFKIVFLSHSSEENLTKHWVRTKAFSANIPCYPCHQMHWGFEHCTKDEFTGGALCAARINPDDVVEAVMGELYGSVKIAV